MNILHIHSPSEQRCDFSRSEARDAASDAGDQEGHLRMLFGEGDKLVNEWFDGVYTALHGRDSIALSLQAHALSHNGSESLNGNSCCAAAVHTLQVASEDEYLVFVERVDTVGCGAIMNLFHVDIVLISKGC